MTTVYVPIVTDVDCKSTCIGVFYEEKDARDSLIAYLVKEYHLPHDIYLECLADLDEKEQSSIYQANLQTEEEFIKYFSDHCSNTQDLIKHIENFGDTYYNQKWTFQIETKSLL